MLPDSDSDRTTCDYCGAHVTAEFRRTYGTPDRRAKRCPECDSWVRLQAGSACGKDIDHPDPQNHAERNGGVDLRRKQMTDGGELS